MRSDNILKQKYWFSVSPFVFNLVYVAAVLLMYNPLFFRKFYEVSPSGMFFAGGLLCIFLLLNAAANILLFRPIAKFVAILLLMINSVVYYFMITYNISIDKVMLLNLLETDWNEAKETFSYSILAYAAFLGVLPSIVVYKTEILSRSAVSELCRRALTIVISLLVVAGLVFANFKTTAQFMRNNKPLKYSLIPVNYFGAVVSLVKIKLTEVKGPLEVVADDAFLIRYWENPNKKNLVVMVVGETARAQNWGLNGYEVDTTAPLNPYKNEIFNFTDVKACGTSTEISLPCMFALEGQHDFNRWKAKRRENLLDVAKAVGYEVLWRNNNSGCKGICARVETETPCQTSNCYDDILNENLAERLMSSPRDRLVVLHQKGSHGPTYYLRYPKSAEIYKPACKTERLDKCSDEEIVNVYNNTIHYTAQNLANLIEQLRTLSDVYNVTIIYMSDHGESLGENGIYLHAAPYRFAPEGQVKVPFMIWMDNQTAENLKIDRACMMQYLNRPYSHDNLFHTALGVLGISTAVYKPELDVLEACRNSEKF